MPSEIKMPYTEYKELLDTIEKQQKFIKMVKENPNTVIIERDGYGFGHYVKVDVPRIHCNEDSIFQELKEKFKEISKDVFELDQQIKSEVGRRNADLGESKIPSNKWYNKIFK